MVDLSKSKKPSVFVLVLLLSSLTYVVGLAWNSFFQRVAERYIAKENTIVGYLIYAVTMTLMLTIMAFISIRYFPSIT